MAGMDLEYLGESCKIEYLPVPLVQTADCEPYVALLCLFCEDKKDSQPVACDYFDFLEVEQNFFVSAGECILEFSLEYLRKMH